jgi:hypothetical protein
MRYIITESQYSFLIGESRFDPEVAKIQKVLVDKGYNLGKYGPKKDGVDGILGPLTRKAYKSEFGDKTTTTEPESKIQQTISNVSGDYDGVLIGGLDYRDGDLDIDSQVQKLGKRNIKGFRYNTPTSTVLEFLNSNPNIPVYMFSAGCTKAYDISQSPNVDKNKVYIIEPFASSSTTKQIVQSAVSNGVPAENVFVGPNSSRGANVVSGASSSNAQTHWDALRQVGSIR